MFGYRISLWRNVWRRNASLRAVVTIAVAMFVTVAILSAAAWIASAPVDAPKSVALTETEYCYTSEDGDWLICRLKE